MPDTADSVVDLEWGGGHPAAGEALLEVSVSKVWYGFQVEPEGDSGDDVAIAVGGVEDAGAVAEAAEFGREGDERQAFKVKGVNCGDGGGDLLAIRSDVLDWAAANQAGNSSETLYAADPCFCDEQDKSVPVKTGGYSIGERSLGRRGADAVAFKVSAFYAEGIIDGYLQNYARVARIVDQKIAASAEDENWETTGAREINSLEKLVLVADSEEEASRAPNSESGVGGEWNVLLKIDARLLHELILIQSIGMMKGRRWQSGVGVRTMDEGHLVWWSSMWTEEAICIQRLW